MSSILDSTVNVPSADTIQWVQHKGAEQLRSYIQRIRGVEIDLTGWSITGSIRELVTAIGVRPTSGFKLTSGESWAMTMDNGLIGNDPDLLMIGRADFIIPQELSRAVTDRDGRSGVPTTQPAPGESKYYQFVIWLDNFNGLRYPILGLFEVQYSDGEE